MKPVVIVAVVSIKIKKGKHPQSGFTKGFWFGLFPMLPIIYIFMKYKNIGAYERVKCVFAHTRAKGKQRKQGEEICRTKNMWNRN